MKTLYIAFILLLHLLLPPFQSSAQQKDLHSLARFSYPIFVVTGNEQNTGTAFFYQSRDTSFLVSNYHAIKGMSPLKQTIRFSSDTVFLKYPVKNSAQFKVLAIDISDAVTGKTEIFSMIERVDLLKIPVELPADADIHYINKLVDPAYFNAVPEQVVIYGYPVRPGSIPAFYARQERLDGRYNSNGFAEYDSTVKIKFPDISDSARAIMNSSARYYYFIRPFASQGYSGSPVFGRYRTVNNKFVYRFMGVVFAGQTLTRQTWAIRGDVAMRYLEN